MDILTGLNNTPAPWSVKREDIGDDCFCVVPIEIIGSDGFKVVSSEGGLAPDRPWKAETIEANASLLVAAPEMYATLILALEELESIAEAGDWHSDSPAILAIQQVIAEIKDK